MFVQEIKTPFIKVKVKDHKKNKKELLKLIKETTDLFLIEQSARVSKSDWNITDNSKKIYLNNFLNLLKPELKLYLDYFKSDKFEIQNVWFHSYKKDDHYSWHTHPRANFTNIYYLDLPNKKDKTEIKDLNGDIIKFEVEEGDLITFPAFIVHRSPPTKNKKTTIVFNSSLYTD
jgi:hypothetical protein